MIQESIPVKQTIQGRLCVRKFTRSYYLGVGLLILLALFCSSLYYRQPIPWKPTDDAHHVTLNDVRDGREDAQPMPYIFNRFIKTRYKQDDAQPLTISSQNNQSEINNQRLPLIDGGEDPDEDVQKKRDKVKEVTISINNGEHFNLYSTEAFKLFFHF